MSDKNKNIEDFFKKLSDGYQDDIDFNEEHWYQMESMLDEKMPSGSSLDQANNFSNGFSTLVVIALLLGMLWNYTVQRELKSLTTEEVNTDQPKLVIVDEVPEQEIALDNSDQNNPTGSLNTRIISGQSDATNSSKVQTLAESSSSLDEISKIQTNTTLTQKDQSETEIRQEADSEKKEDNGQSVGRGIIVLDEVLDSKSDYLIIASIPIAFHAPAYNLPSSLQQVHVGNDFSTIIQTSQKNEDKTFSRFGIGLSISPDLSSNQIMSYNRFGTDIGVFIEYRISKKISLESGVVTAKKKYVVSGDSYAPPSGFWGRATGGEVPSEIEASCNVLDIPINLRYRLFENEKSSISFSAGVSSYIMMTEDYQYTLASGYWDWGIEGQNKHFFGVGNLQAYYERKLGRHFSIEAAPFLKLPLMGFGHGNIKFHSIGTYITIKRYFNLF